MLKIKTLSELFIAELNTFENDLALQLWLLHKATNVFEYESRVKWNYDKRCFKKYLLDTGYMLNAEDKFSQNYMPSIMQM